MGTPIDEVTADIARLEKELAETRARAVELVDVLNNPAPDDRDGVVARLAVVSELLAVEQLVMTRFSVLEHARTTLAGLQPAPAEVPAEAPVADEPAEPDASIAAPAPNPVPASAAPVVPEEAA